MEKLHVIIPCYNEENRLNFDEIDKLIELMPLIHIVLANDGSSDNTIGALQKVEAKYPDKVSIFDYKKNCGKAMVLYNTINSLLEDEQVKIIGYLDADFATDAVNFHKVCVPVFEKRAIFSIGSRVKLLGKNINRKVMRHYIGRFVITFLGFKHSLPIYDTQCGAKVFRSEILKEVLYGKPFKCNWLFDYELFIRLKKKNLLAKGEEVPLDSWVDIAGSKLSYKTAFKILREMLKIYSIQK